MPYTPPGYFPQQYYPQSNPYADQLTQLKSQPMYQPMQQNLSTNGLLWVQGEAGAKSYLVAPGNTLLLLDSEADKFYIKSVDPNGMPQMRTFEYREVTNVPAAAAVPQEQQVDHVTHEELDGLREEFKTEIQKITDLFVKKTATRKGVTEPNE